MSARRGGGSVSGVGGVSVKVGSVPEEDFQLSLLLGGKHLTVIVKDTFP